MERYDKIEYNFDETSQIPPNDSIATTDSEGFITSQQYAATDEALNENEFPEEFAEPEPTRQRDKNAPRETVLVLQLTVCILLAIAAYVIKSIGGEVYENIKTFYDDNINNSIIIELNNDKNLNFVSDVLNNDSK